MLDRLGISPDKYSLEREKAVNDKQHFRSRCIRLSHELKTDDDHWKEGTFELYGRSVTQRPDMALDENVWDYSLNENKSKPTKNTNNGAMATVLLCTSVQRLERATQW